MKHIQTHEFLGITKSELAALRKVREGLDTGAINRHNFCMRSWWIDGYRIGCIGGWMVQHGCDEDLINNKALRHLFFPLHNVYRKSAPQSITMAKKAIDRFLMGMGEKCWSF